jgi:hypothetical protein
LQFLCGHFYEVDAKKTMVDVMVIDAASQPVAN